MLKDSDTFLFELLTICSAYTYTASYGLAASRALFWHFPIYLPSFNAKNENRDPKFRTRPGFVGRYGKWKLHHYFEDDEMELYDLGIDIGEKENLVDVYPKKAEELYQLLKDWIKETNAPIPTRLNPEYIADD